MRRGFPIDEARSPPPSASQVMLGRPISIQKNSAHGSNRCDIGWCPSNDLLSPQSRGPVRMLKTDVEAMTRPGGVSYSGALGERARQEAPARSRWVTRRRGRGVGRLRDARRRLRELTLYAGLEKPLTSRGSEGDEG